MKPTRQELRDALETIADLCDGANSGLDRCIELKVHKKTITAELAEWIGRIRQIAENYLSAEDDNDDNNDDGEPEEIFLIDDDDLGG